MALGLPGMLLSFPLGPGLREVPSPEDVVSEVRQGVCVGGCVYVGVGGGLSPEEAVSEVRQGVGLQQPPTACEGAGGVLSQGHCRHLGHRVYLLPYTL